MDTTGKNEQIEKETLGLVLEEFTQEQKITNQTINDLIAAVNTIGSKVEKLEAKLSGLSHNDINIKDLLDKGIDILLKLDYIYETADIEKKKEVISSMFPEKLHFENSSLRTGRVNEAVRFIYMIDSNLGGNKKGQAKNKFGLSCKVALPVQFSNFFIKDLKRLAAANTYGTNTQYFT